MPLCCRTTPYGRPRRAVAGAFGGHERPSGDAWRERSDEARRPRRPTPAVSLPFAPAAAARPGAVAERRPPGRGRRTASPPAPHHDGAVPGRSLAGPRRPRSRRRSPVADRRPGRLVPVAPRRAPPALRTATSVPDARAAPGTRPSPRWSAPAPPVSGPPVLRPAFPGRPRPAARPPPRTATGPSPRGPVRRRKWTPTFRWRLKPSATPPARPRSRIVPSPGAARPPLRRPVRGRRRRGRSWCRTPPRWPGPARRPRPGTGPVMGNRAAQRAERQAADMARRKAERQRGSAVAVLDDEPQARIPQRVIKGLVAMTIVALGVLGVRHWSSRPRPRRPRRPAPPSPAPGRRSRRRSTHFPTCRPRRSTSSPSWPHRCACRSRS